MDRWRGYLLSYECRRGREKDVIRSDSLLLLPSPGTYILAYSDGCFDAGKAAALADGYGWRTMMGPEDTISRLAPLLPGCRIERRTMYGLERQDFTGKEGRALILSPDQYRDLFALYRKIPEMSDGFDEDEDDANMERFRSRPCPFAAAGIYEDGHLVSGAYLGSHDLICGVATEEGYRRRGYASEVVSCLLSCIFSRSMDAVALWCSDPDAARMYEGIGFRKRAGYIFLRK